MQKLKVGVIGCGSIARHRHLPEYAANAQVEIVAVSDPHTDRAAELADKYGATAYTDNTQLLAHPDLAAVSICTPNNVHAPLTVAALNAGKHVLCEKPMATSREEALAMITAAKQNGKKLMIAHNQRFVPSHKKARELIASGAVGKVYSFRTAFGHRGPESWSIDGIQSWFFNKSEAFVGAMGDLGVHKSDLIRYLLGEEVVEVAAFVDTLAKTDTDVDDNAVCVLRMASGAVGTLTASWSYNAGEDNSTVIYGEKATLRLEEDPAHPLIVQYANGEVERHALASIQSNEEGEQHNSGVIDRFVSCICDDSEPAVSGEEGMKSLAVILAALESQEAKAVVCIDVNA